jgi:hypothetical protein
VLVKRFRDTFCNFPRLFHLFPCRRLTVPCLFELPLHFLLLSLSRFRSRSRGNGSLTFRAELLCKRSLRFQCLLEGGRISFGYRLRLQQPY